MRSLASDNFSGAWPEVVSAVADANTGHAMAYGDDPWTAAARAAFDRLFGQPVDTFFVFNGTAANILALKSAVRPYSAVICGDDAHLYNDESTAPETFLGCRVRPLPCVQGRVDANALETLLHRGHGVHWAQPAVLTITQPTELGTLYQNSQIEELVAVAHDHGMVVHVDGARLGTAVAAVQSETGGSATETLRQMLIETGVDLLSFGGTKQGMLYGEAIVCLNRASSKELAYFHKQGMQLASKTRFIAAQFTALLDNDLWLRGARHANDMARQLGERVGRLGVEICLPVETNAVFGRIEPAQIEPLQARMFFWPWDERSGMVRWMTTFDTRTQEIDALAEELEALRGRDSRPI